MAEHDFNISLAAARVNAGLTQEEVGEKLGVSRDTVGNWERGLVPLKAMQIMALGELYQWPYDHFSLPIQST